MAFSNDKGRHRRGRWWRRGSYLFSRRSEAPPDADRSFWTNDRTAPSGRPSPAGRPDRAREDRPGRLSWPWRPGAGGDRHGWPGGDKRGGDRRGGDRRGGDRRGWPGSAGGAKRHDRPASERPDHERSDREYVERKRADRDWPGRMWPGREPAGRDSIGSEGSFALFGWRGRERHQAGGDGSEGWSWAGRRQQEDFRQQEEFRRQEGFRQPEEFRQWDAAEAGQAQRWDAAEAGQSRRWDAAEAGEPRRWEAGERLSAAVVDRPQYTWHDFELDDVVLRARPNRPDAPSLGDGLRHCGKLETILHRQWDAREGPPSPEVVRAVESLAMLPDLLKEKLAAGLEGIYVGPGGVPDLDDMGYLRGAPLPSGRASWDICAGAYGDGKIVVGDRPSPTPDVMMHEVGHAIDDVDSAYGDWVSDSREFAMLYEDITPLLVSAFHRQGDGLGRKEFFADAFAAIASRQRPALVDMLGGDTRAALNVMLFFNRRYGI
ncbi:hypothetical protein [Nonomuraea sp. NPDC049750]|uniref:hypothetical protein n=2 Tax=unclassified Nonomuraea TaxID=2593643 RepID=UPI0033FD92CE